MRVSENRELTTGKPAPEPTRAEELREAVAEVRAGRRDAYERVVDRFDDRRPFYPWLATIAFRLAQDRWQQQRRDRELARRYGAASEEGVARDDPLRTVIADEESSRLWQAVEGLPGGEQAAVQLFYRQELKISEAAHLLGVSSGTVKTLLFRARRHLREALGTDAPGAPGRHTK